MRESFTHWSIIYSPQHHLLTGAAFTHGSIIYSLEHHLLTGASSIHRSIIYSPEHRLFTGASFTHRSIVYSPEHQLFTEESSTHRLEYCERRSQKTHIVTCECSPDQRSQIFQRPLLCWPVQVGLVIPVHQARFQPATCAPDAVVTLIIIRVIFIFTIAPLQQHRCSWRCTV